MLLWVVAPYNSKMLFLLEVILSNDFIKIYLLRMNYQI